MRERPPVTWLICRPLWSLLPFLPLLAVLLAASAVVPRTLNGDAGPLVGAAHRLLQGRYAVIGTIHPVEFLWHGPGLPALLAPFIALGASAAELRLVSPVAMFVAALLFYRLLRLRLSRRAALTGAYALGLYAPAYYVLSAPAKEPLALVLSILALDATSRYLRVGRRRHALIAGLALGALAMTRLEYGWVIAALLVASAASWAVAHFRGGVATERLSRRGTHVCAVGMLACVPWLLYTYELTGRLFYWGNSGGRSLYWMSAPGRSALGAWHSLGAVFTDPALASYRPLFRHLATLTPVRADLALQHVALTNAIAHPLQYVVNLGANVSRMLAGFPFGFTLPVGMIVGLILINGALLVGMFLAGRTIIHRRPAMPVETVPFLLFALVGFAIHVFPTAEPRMIVPLIPVPIWLIWQRLPDWLAARAGWKTWSLPARARGSLVVVRAAERRVAGAVASVRSLRAWVQAARGHGS